MPSNDQTSSSGAPECKDESQKTERTDEKAILEAINEEENTTLGTKRTRTVALDDEIPSPERRTAAADANVIPLNEPPLKASPMAKGTVAQIGSVDEQQLRCKILNAVIKSLNDAKSAGGIGRDRIAVLSRLISFGTENRHKKFIQAVRRGQGTFDQLVTVWEQINAWE